MSLFINTTGTLGIILQEGTNNITGNLFLTLFTILIILIIIGVMFQIPLEFLAVIILPLCLACASVYNTFLIPVVIILIYFSTIISKNWIFK